jgi:hypothetical protein
MMDKEKNNIYEDLADDVDKVLDDYYSGEKDATASITAVCLESLKAKLKPYHEELQNMEKSEIFGHIGLILNLLTDKESIAKEEQQVKEKLRQIKKIFNAIYSSKDEKDEYIKKIFEDMFVLLDNIYILLSGGNNRG